MSVLISIFLLTGIPIIANVAFIFNKFGKNHKEILLDTLKKLSNQLNYTYIEDKSTYLSVLKSNQIHIGNDLYLNNYNLRVVAMLYFSILCNIAEKKGFGNKIQFLNKVLILFSVVFSLLICDSIFQIDMFDIMGFFIGLVYFITIILGIACFYHFSRFKKLLQNTSQINSLELERIYISLYWYIPILVLTAPIGFIEHIKWLFSKNEN